MGEETIPEKSNNDDFYVVGIGASAGGLEAIDTLFDHMPPNTGMAFVVIQHLSPDYKSLMVELLSKHTRMEVLRAEEGMVVEPDKIYLIPPKKNLTIFHGKLLLSEQGNKKVLNFPIDIFLESLAEDKGNHAVGVILSGTGSDGMRGIKDIKEKGGMVMAQNEDSAKFDGMPRSAISTGLVDFILPPEEMPERLLSFIDHPYATSQQNTMALLTDQDGMDRLFSLLRKKHKVDFTHYKMSTVVRRIERRMMVNHIDNFREYVKYMEEYPHEVTTLYRELLIGVTHFFRDPEAFDLISDLVCDIITKADKKEIRFWVAGCSTGEEPYSIAILIKECMERLGKTVNVKVFATDVDGEAILKAANGRFPESIIADVPSERLSKYFIPMENEFRISREIREMVVFAKHDVLTDPPFANMDMISCRNLLIYLQPVLQSRVLELFNYSLKPGGIMFLGPSETTGDMSEYFEPVNHKWKIYRSRGKAKLDMQKIRNITLDSSRIRTDYKAPSRAWKPILEEKLLERIVDSLQDDYLPLTIITNENMEVVYTLGDTEGYFKLPSGKMVSDITKMVSKELSIPISTGLQKVFSKKEDINYTNVRAVIKGEKKKLNVRIKHLPTKMNQEPLAAIFLTEVSQEKKDGIFEVDHVEYDMGKVVEQRISDLEQELQFTRENLQATIEELETSNEELQATNEELFASNEELQSTNEELQSVNEELHTVNTEYQAKIIELSELNQDMENIMSNTQIGILFLDENLEIRKFTGMMKNIFHLVDNDIGRSLEGLSSKLEDVDIMDIIRQVQENESIYEAEVRTDDDRWYLLKALPYKIARDTYSGIIVTIIDILKLKTTQVSLEKSDIWLKEAASLTRIGGWEIDPVTMRTFWTEEVYRIHEVDPEYDHNVENGLDFYHPEDRKMIEEAVSNALERGEAFDLKLRFVTAKGNHRFVRVIGKAEMNNKKVKRVYGSFQDITEQTLMENELSEVRIQSKEPYLTITSPTIFCENDHDGRFIIKEINCAGKDLFSTGDNNLLGKDLLGLLPEQNEVLADALLSVRDRGESVYIPAVDLQFKSYNGPFEIYVYKVPCGEIATIFYRLDGESDPERQNDNTEKDT